MSITGINGNMQTALKNPVEPNCIKGICTIVYGNYLFSNLGDFHLRLLDLYLDCDDRLDPVVATYKSLGPHGQALTGP